MEKEKVKIKNYLKEELNEIDKNISDATKKIKNLKKQKKILYQKQIKYVDGSINKGNLIVCVEICGGKKIKNIFEYCLKKH